MKGLKINRYKSIEEAPNYRNIGGYNAATLVEVGIVEKGMQSGLPSVDLVFVDEQGNKFVALLPGRLFAAAGRTVGVVVDQAEGAM